MPALEQSINTAPSYATSRPVCRDNPMQAMPNVPLSVIMRQVQLRTDQGQAPASASCAPETQQRLSTPQHCILINTLLPAPAAGLLLQKELDYLDGAVSNPKRPFVAIVGGSKVRAAGR